MPFSPLIQKLLYWGKGTELFEAVHFINKSEQLTTQQSKSVVLNPPPPFSVIDHSDNLMGVKNAKYKS